MTTQIATTIEQSKRMIALGAIPENADMHYSTFIPDEPCLVIGKIVSEDDIPAWSLSALMEMLPNGVDFMRCRNRKEGSNEWRLHYIANWDQISIYVDNESLIEACVTMIERIEYGNNEH